jgi:hypothetical protein
MEKWKTKYAAGSGADYGARRGGSPRMRLRMFGGKPKRTPPRGSDATGNSLSPQLSYQNFE